MVKYHSTREALGKAGRRAAQWDSGLFFDSSSDLAHWRSQAITVASALEGLGKYALAYDCDDAPFGSRRLAILPVSGRDTVALAVVN